MSLGKKMRLRRSSTAHLMLIAKANNDEKIIITFSLFIHPHPRDLRVGLLEPVSNCLSNTLATSFLNVFHHISHSVFCLIPLCDGNGMSKFDWEWDKHKYDYKQIWIVTDYMQSGLCNQIPNICTWTLITFHFKILTIRLVMFYWLHEYILSTQ